MPTTVCTSDDRDRILTVTIGLDDKPATFLSHALLMDLDDVVSSVERDRPRGVIFTSAKPYSFLSGPDIIEVRRMTRHQLDEYLALGQSVFLRIASLHMPTAAAINGDALGAGLELALVCGHRLAADDARITIGLPEVRLGLVPGFGGTVRLPRLAGLAPALSMMMAGQVLTPREAQHAGIVDQVVARDALAASASRLLLACPVDHPNLRADRSAADSPQERNRVLDEAEFDADSRSRGRYPALARLVSVVRTGYEHGSRAGMAAERAAVIELSEGETSRNLVRFHILRQHARKAAADRAGAPPLPVERAAVVGGGTMGTGIAHALVRAGIETHLIEKDPELASRAAQRVRAILADDLAAGRIGEPASHHASGLLHPACEWTGIDAADIVIEAVVEQPSVKQDLFARLDQEARPAAILASNTSSISISTIAACTSRPGRVIGLHFFNPVPRMALLEIVRGEQSEGPAVATAVALGARLGKVPVLAGDAPGFIVNAVLVPYLCEAVRMVEEGIDVAVIDRALVDWGWPMGPLTLIDHIGIDVLAGMVQAMAPSRPAQVALPQPLIEGLGHGVCGRKSGRGFYLYDPPSQRGPPVVNAELVMRLVRSAPPHLADEQVQWRLMLMMANEAARVLEHRVADSAGAIDLSVLLGLGMAPFRGGILRWCDSVGAAEVVAGLNDLFGAQGPRFAPNALLADRARMNQPICEPQR